MASKAQLKAMSIDELEDLRNGLVKEMAGLKAEFRAAGEVRAAKIAETPRAQGLALMDAGRKLLAEESE